MENERKKVLIITYYWPPAGGPGVQRILKFVKYLPKFGWDPIVLTVANGEYPAIDESLIDEIPKDIKVFKTKTIEFFNLFKVFTNKKKEEKIDTFILGEKTNSLKDKLFRWVRANIFIPDGRIGWKYYAVNKAIEIIKTEGIDSMISSSPPHSVQVIAGAIREKTGIPWLADLRDPWLGAFWEKDLKRMAFAENIGKKQEQKLFLKADKISVVSNGMKRDFEKKYNRQNLTIITNGYDQSDFSKLKKTPNEKLSIVYTGSIAHSQNPSNLIEAINQLSEEEKQKITLDIYGSVDSTFYKIVDDCNLKHIVNFKKYIPHNEVVQVMKNADVLLLLIPRMRPDILTGKIFEYIGTGNAIMCLGPEGEARDIISKLENGMHFGYEDDLISTINKLIIDHNFKKFDKTPTSSNSEYTRKYLTKLLATNLNELCR